jgi:iron complex transport system ATP-binding protein
MLEVDNLSFSYGRHPALERVSLSVETGEIVVVIGPNGSGKSTLIRALSGALSGYQGTVRVGGANLHTMSATQRARLVAVVPQARSLPPVFSVFQCVLMGRTPYLGWLGHTSQTDIHHVWDALEQTECLEMAERSVGELSGGEQQRVLLARALAQDTRVLLLDEPTTHLDLHHQSALLNLVRSLAGRQKLAVLMVLHDLNLASLYSDRVVLLVDGQLRAVGSPEQVLTEQNLSQVYHVPVHVLPHPDYGSPLILPNGKMGAGI